ncbi:MAG TPA: peptidylprolyl isomerase [Pirellulales bacterium]|nr:peptidylprolyl isomerase [Pirellulales bacterium]
MMLLHPLVRRASRLLARRTSRLEPLEARLTLAADPIVTVNTTLGSFQIELFPNVAPQTVANFLHYVNSGSYTDTVFHRSVPGFVEQTGGFTSASPTFSSVSQFGTIPTGAAIPNEFNMSNVLGTVAMAFPSGEPNGATDQWFVNLADNSSILDSGGFTVFGRVLGNGMQVLDQMATLPISNQGGNFTQLPLAPNNQLVEITSVTQDTGILGTVYHDVNLNGARDASEPVVAGATVYIDANNNGVLDPGEVSTLTDANGQYAFTGLAPGSYVVREQVVANHGVQVTAPAGDAATVTVSTGVISAGPDFGQFQTSVVAPLPLPNVSYPLSGDANANYVEGLFVNLLGHAADPASLTVWTEQLAAGATLDSVARGVWDSAEHLGLEVDAFYSTFLHRAAEPAGRGYWIGLLQAGMGEQQVVEGFLASPEYQTLNSGAAAMTAALYNDVLSRPGEAAGLTAWQTWLQTNSPLLAASAFVQSAESQQRIVDAFFSAFLRRGTDVSDPAWVNELETGAATIQDVAVGILSSSEYFSDATVNAGH